MSAPVLICGAGPVGLATALGLAHCGVPSTVVDRKPAADQHSRATLILPRTLEIAAQWAVLDPLLAAGSRVPHVRLREPHRAHRAERSGRAGDEILHVNFTKLADQTATPFALAVPQDRTERVLLDAAEGTGLVEVRFDTELTSFDQDDHGVEVTIRTSGQTSAGTPDEHTERVGYLVGADGAHSAVRHHLGIELTGKTYPTPAMLADVRIDPAHDQPDYWPTILGHRGIVVAIRFGHGVWRIIEQAVDQHDDPDRDGTDRDNNDRDNTGLDDHIRATTVELFGTEPTEIIWRSVYRKHERCAPRFRDGRVLLAGDAAHLNSPAGGQGMNSGIQDAHNLAWRLAAAVTTPHTDHTRQAYHTDHGALLESYSQERVSLIQRRVLPATDLAERFQTMRPHRRTAITRALDAIFSFPHSTGALTERFAMLTVPYRPSRLLATHDEPIGQRLPDTIGLDGTRIYTHLPHGGLVWAGPHDTRPDRLATDLGLPLLDGDLAALTRFFDRDRYLALIRPDHIVAALCDPTAIPAESFHAALGRILPA